MKRQFGEVIGIRRLDKEERQKKSIITVTMGRPRQRSDGDWECPFRITGLKTQYGYGVDSIQALSTALEGIRAVLSQKESQLSWLGGERGYTGFDRLVTTSLGAKFTKKINQVIDREIITFVNKLERKSRKGKK